MEIAIGLGLFALGVVVDRVIANWSRLTRRPAVDVLVEQDPAIFLAGQEPWDFFEYVVPDQSLDDVGSPPSNDARDWYRWIAALGGLSANEQRIQVILIPRGTSTILVEAFVVKIARFDDPLSGTHVGCPVGGAEGTVRHIHVDLAGPNAPLVSYRAAGEGEIMQPFKFTIGPGDAERFEIMAWADAYVEWTGDLHLIADGRRVVLTIDNDGKPFRITGTSAAESYFWYGSSWERVE